MTPTQSFPATQLIKQLNLKNDQWKLYAKPWRMMELLYAGGVEIEAEASQFLMRRPKELPDVFQCRQDQFRYQDHVGTAIDYYAAALFEDPPAVEVVKPPQMAPAVAPPPPKPLLPGMPPPPPPAFKPIIADVPAKHSDFYDDFAEDCDGAGTSLLDLYGEIFKDLLIYGRAVRLIDLPKAGEYMNLAEQKDAGALDPYVVNYKPSDMIDWSCNERGDLDWVRFYARHEERTPLGESRVKDCWYIFTRTDFAAYEYLRPKGDESKEPNEDAIARLTDFGRHSLADSNQVPVVYYQLPKGLWLMNRSYLAIKDHLNTDNVLGWALYMAALAMPVVKCDDDFDVSLSESGFIKLPYESEYGWSEPEGKSFDKLGDRVEDLMQQIFRAFYLISQARTNKATPASQSGISKQQDMTPSKKILNKFGAIMRTVIQQLRNMVSNIRQDGLEWDVRGLEFPEDPPDEELFTVGQALELNVPSELFRKELFKKAVTAVMRDANEALRTAMFDEIDQAPTQAQADMNDMAQKAKLIAQVGMKPKDLVVP